MSDQTQQKDIDNAAWATRDTFSGVMDAARDKDNIFGTPFLKYEKRYGGNDEHIQHSLKNELFVLPEDCNSYGLIPVVDGEGHEPRFYTLDEIIPGDYRVTIITTSEDHVEGIADIDREAVTSDDRADGLVRLIQSWMDEDDAGEQRETLEYLIHALDKDRLSDRKLFPKELKGKSW